MGAKRFFCVRAGICLLALVTLLPRSVAAAWPTDPHSNLPLCTAFYNQLNPLIIPDGAGGAIVAWTDRRTGHGINDYSAIYAQHILASGVVAWPVDGLAVCPAAGGQGGAQIASDGAGGAIITWLDGRRSYPIPSFPYIVSIFDIYAQRLLANGTVAPGWPVNGVAIDTTVGNDLQMVADGVGGAIVSWSEKRGADYDIYARRILASGVVTWSVNGLPVCTAARDQQNPEIVTDGASGAIITWLDPRAFGSHIYAQRVLASGVVAAGWPANGRALCTAPNGRYGLGIATDGAGGAIVTWGNDTRSGASGDVYAEHVMAGGTVDPTWPVDGSALCTALNAQRFPDIISDGGGGAIVTWWDNRRGVGDIYAQHLLASGAVDGTWPPDGRALSTSGGGYDSQEATTIETDGTGGAIVAWSDNRDPQNQNWDIYAQHVFASGAVDPAWPVDGGAVCIAHEYQTNPTIATDGAGGAILTWQDNRHYGDYPDIYAQRVRPDGLLGEPESPRILGVQDVPNDQGGKLRVTWKASSLDDQVSYYTLRRRQGSFWQPAAIVTATGGTSYQSTVSTASDSVSGPVPWNVFMVEIQADDVTYASPADSGYSIDNLPPATPAAFTGEYAGGVATMHWSANSEPDLTGYRLHRGSSPDFEPGPSNLLASLSDTGYVDNAGGPYIYKLAAIDVHGNLSDFTALLPTGIVGVGGEGQPSLTLDLVGPNPTRARAVAVRFTLARAADAWLELLDVGGRRIAAREVGSLGVGQHALRLDEGRRLAPGVYLVRLRQGSETRAGRLVVLE